MSLYTRHPRSVAAAAMLVTGAVQALTFAPGPLPTAALALVQVLMLAVLAQRQLNAPGWRRALWEGWLFNFSCYSLGLYWLFISMHWYGGLAVPLAAAGVLALAAFLALFPAAGGALAWWLADWRGRASGTPRPPGICSGLRAAVAYAAALAALEWVRGNLWTGFPWLNIGYAHVDSPLAGWAPVLGVYGVAALAAFAAAALALLWQPAATARLDARRAVPAAAALLLAVAGALLARADWSTPFGAPLSVRLVQGNVPQSQKFDPALMQQGLIQHMKQAALPPPPGTPAPQVIILPETVLPVFQDDLSPEIWQTWRRIAAERDATIVMGVPLHQRIAGKDSYTNSAIAFDANTPLQALRDGTVAMRYDKHHLVPWGEFVPPGFRWFVNLLNIPLGDFDRGPTRQQPFDIAGQRLALNICYEDLFGEELLPALHTGANGEPGATVLVNISNLGWFGDSWALRQHLQIGRMRTLETARPMLAATNTGITANIDARGRVAAQLPPHQQAQLATTVQGTSGLTPYARVGNLAMEIIIGATLLGLAFTRLRAARRDRAGSV